MPLSSLLPVDNLVFHHPSHALKPGDQPVFRHALLQWVPFKWKNAAQLPPPQDRNLPGDAVTIAHADPKLVNRIQRDPWLGGLLAQLDDKPAMRDFVRAVLTHNAPVYHGLLDALRPTDGKPLDAAFLQQEDSAARLVARCLPQERIENAARSMARILVDNIDALALVPGLARTAMNNFRARALNDYGAPPEKRQALLAGVIAPLLEGAKCPDYEGDVLAPRRVAFHALEAFDELVKQETGSVLRKATRTRPATSQVVAQAVPETHPTTRLLFEEASKEDGVLTHVLAWLFLPAVRLESVLAKHGDDAPALLGHAFACDPDICVRMALADAGTTLDGCMRYVMQVLEGSPFLAADRAVLSSWAQRAGRTLYEGLRNAKT